MLFIEFRFFWFFLAVFCVYWSLRENRARKIWLRGNDRYHTGEVIASTVDERSTAAA